MTNNYSQNLCKKFLLIVFFLLLASCSLYETPPLPDINKESFSYEEIVQKKNELEVRQKVNSKEYSNENFK